jgi:hypothetical protein
MLPAAPFIKEKSQIPLACSVCESKKINPFGAKDFGVSGGDFFEKKRLFPEYKLPISYYQCGQCKFVFTNEFDGWRSDDFCAHIYNDDYVVADRPFLEERPVRNANLVASLFMREREKISIMDFCGGNGVFASTLCSLGFKTDVYDPFFGKTNTRPSTYFDLVTSFEVIEHVPHHNQKQWMGQIAALLKPHPSARVLLSTELISEHQSIQWWYICPRNGHISIHSRSSLTMLAAQVGLTLFSANDSMHFLAHDGTQFEK